MFPSAKKRKGLSPGKPPRKDKVAKSPKRNGPGGQLRNRTGKGWKKSRDGEKTKPGRKTLGPRAGDREKKFGRGKRFEGNKKDKSFKSKGQSAKSGFKKKGAGGKQGFKHRKGKG